MRARMRAVLASWHAVLFTAINRKDYLMCQFFSAIVTRDLRVLFTEQDSHETIIRRAELQDNDLYLRSWVRVELQPEGNNWYPLRVDESSTPAWFDDSRDTIAERVKTIAQKVASARAAYDAAVASARAARDAAVAPARAVYDAAVAPARAAYDAAAAPAWAACDAAEASARAACDAAVAPARAAYNAAVASARAACDAAVAPARAAYNAAGASARAAYNAAAAPARAACDAAEASAWAAYNDYISLFEGYIPERKDSQ